MTNASAHGTAKRITTRYDEIQHCTALREPDGLEVAMDCPYTGKGEELSPTNLVEAALGGCMLMAMGAFATRHEIDLSGAEIAVGITPAERLRFGAIDIVVTPGASESKLMGFNPWRKRFEVKIKAPAKKGKANTELIAYFAQLLELPANDIELLSGQTATFKTIGIKNQDFEDIYNRLISLIS